MPIIESDVKFRASQRMTDFADGGGLMSTTTIVDGVDNNLFDDITDLQRLFGHLSLRKVYGAVLSNNADTYISAHALVDVPPTDAATGCFAFATGGLTTERAAALSALSAWYVIPGTDPWPVNAPSGTTTVNLTVGPSIAAGAIPTVGMALGMSQGGTLDANDIERVQVLTVGAELTNGITGDKYRQCTVSAATTRTYGTGDFGGGNASSARAVGGVSLTETRPYGVATAPGATSAGTTIVLDSITTAILGVGTPRVLRPNDAVLIASTIANAAAAVSNGSTTTTGRTSLSRLRVIGNSGVVHASFVLNQPVPSGVGCTADLTAGTVTFTDVSGMSQPVTVEHRIEEMSVVASIAGTTLTLSRALSRAYPAGTRVSSLLMLGDLKARVGVTFAQTAWTGVFADAVLGGSPAADYDIAGNPIVVTNKGAVNERWYALFTNTTTFRLIGEQLGEIGTFGTGSVCAPNNPATGVPYFTIPSVGWGSGWAAGNVFRFNTAGANAPIWVGRSVAPSTPAGDDSVTLQFRGYVNT